MFDDKDELFELVMAVETINNLLDNWELVRKNSYIHHRIRDALSKLKSNKNYSELFVREEEKERVSNNE